LHEGRPAATIRGVSALEDIRIVDLSQNLAGPFCTYILAELGADVVKVEAPGGDPARTWGPPFWNGESPIFMSGNGGKRSLALDLKTEAGRGIVRALAERADVFVQSFRSGVVESLGFGYDDVAALNPRIVYCSVTAYGARGPLRDLPGYDPLMQAHGGLISVTGQPGQPSRVGSSVVDMGTGMWSAIGVLAALERRRRTGRGEHVVTSLYETTLAWNAYHLMNYMATGAVAAPSGTAFPLIAPYEAFPTADGELMIAAASDGLFHRLCHALALPDLLEDDRFVDNPSRVANRPALVERIGAATHRLSTAALESNLREAGVPCAPILGMDAVAEAEQTRASGMVRRVPHPGIPDFASLALPVEWDGRRAEPERAPPRCGEHTHEILQELGYDAPAIARLERDGAVRSYPETEDA
jgi:crotonobetainyl-CoA:carnitine CoA-transferase CaiB-like acyl-CoA transferase